MKCVASIVCSLAVVAASEKVGLAAIASDSAASPVYADGFSPGENGGSGFAPWSLSGSGGGFFVSNEDRQSAVPGEPHKFPSPQSLDGGYFFGLWHSDSGERVVSRTLANAATLGVGDTASFAFEHGWVDDGRRVGFRLLDGNGDSRLEFGFLGGGGTGYYLTGSTTQFSTQGWTPAGMVITFALTGPDTFSVNLDFNSGTDQVLTGTLGAGSELTTIAFFSGNQYGGWERDVYVNSLSIVPEPASLASFVVAGCLVRRRRV